MGDVAYDARFSVCNRRYTQDIIFGHLVTSPFKSNISRFFGKNYCRKTIKATTVKKLPNEHKLIYAIHNFIVASWCLLFSYGSHLNTTTHLNGIRNRDILKCMFALNVTYLRTKIIIILIFYCILLFYI